MAGRYSGAHVTRWETLTRRVGGPVAALALGVYFFRLTRSSLHGFLSPDDITNLYRACSYPLGLLVRANLLFFQTSPFYRPIPSAWYRTVFHFAGLNPVPYHATNLLILAANILLTYGVARRLSGSRATGWLAALLACYHTQFNGLYFDTAFIFDVLCYFFYFSTFLFYLRVRQAGHYLRSWPLAACCALYICALNSKEMAVTLPLFLGLYEWLYHPPAQRRWRELYRWLLAEGRGMLATGALTLMFVIGRITGEFSLARMAAYRPIFTWDRLMLTSRQFLGDLFFLINQFTPATILLLWAVLGLIAWTTKSRTLRFAWFFLMLSAAPVAFVEPRGAAQYYLPLFGWALYFATALTGLSRRLIHPLRGPAGLWTRRLRGPILLAAVMLLLYPRYKAMGWSNVTSVTVDGEMVRSLAAQIRTLHPTLPEGARLLLLNETDDAVWENLVSVVRLAYDDHSIKVDRVRRMNRKLEHNEIAAYDHLLDYRDGRLLETYRAPDPRLQPRVCWSPQGPEIYHPDWSAVTSQNPARGGEILITKATGLGATAPDVPIGEPFPADPLIPVNARVAVKLNGLRAEMLNAIGWPQTVNRYRVDFRVPVGTKPGMAEIEISVRGVPAPTVQIPVR